MREYNEMLSSLVSLFPAVRVCANLWISSNDMPV